MQSFPLRHPWVTAILITVGVQLAFSGLALLAVAAARPRQALPLSDDLAAPRVVN